MLMFKSKFILKHILIAHNRSKFAHKFLVMSKANEIKQTAENGLKQIRVMLSAIFKKLKFSTLATEDGSIVVQTPSDEVKEGDKVLVEKDGSLNEQFTGDVVVMGNGNKYKLSIVDGVIKTVEVVEKEQQPQEQKKEENQNSVAMSAVVDVISKAIDVKFSAIEKENSELKKQIVELNKKIETLWKNIPENRNEKKNANVSFRDNLMKMKF